jgi:integrase
VTRARTISPCTTRFKASRLNGYHNLMLRRAKGKRDRAALTLLADTGLRSSELCGLRWRDVSSARDTSALHNLRRTVRNAAKAAGIGHVTPRTLRRSIATAYAEATVPAHVAVSVTGHSPAVYNAHYVKPHRDRMERENALKQLLAFGYGTE